MDVADEKAQACNGLANNRYRDLTSHTEAKHLEIWFRSVCSRYCDFSIILFISFHFILFLYFYLFKLSPTEKRSLNLISAAFRAPKYQVTSCFEECEFIFLSSPTFHLSDIGTKIITFL